jgi:hypothetical protein
VPVDLDFAIVGKLAQRGFLGGVLPCRPDASDGGFEPIASGNAYLQTYRCSCSCGNTFTSFAMILHYFRLFR